MLTEDGCVSLRFSEKLTGYGAFWLYKILEAKKVLKRTKKSHVLLYAALIQ